MGDRGGTARPAKRPTAIRSRRRRRTAEEAREQILDAAERRLATEGPEGIRLKQIAGDAGLSHSTLLHHFGSRQALVEALVQRTMRGLAHDLRDAIQSRNLLASAPATLQRVFQTLGDQGHARLLVWRVLGGWTHPGRALEGTLLRQLIEALHQRRVALHREWGARLPPRANTTFTSLLATFAVVGEAVVGQLVLGEDGVGMSSAEFRGSLVELVLERLVGDAPAAREALVREPAV